MAVSKGTTTTIDTTGSATSIDSARISDTQMLVIYRDSATILGARVCDINTGAKSITANAQSDIAYAFSLLEISMVRLSATKFIFVSVSGQRASVLNVSGTTVTGGPITVLTDSPLFNTMQVLPLTSTTALLIYSYGTGSTVDAVARVLSIDGSDNVTEGSLLILESDPTSVGAFSAQVFNNATAAFLWQDQDDNFFLKGQLFTISGTSLALSGGVQTLYTAKDGWSTATTTASFSSSEIAVAHNIDEASSEELVCHVISLAGSTLSAGASLQLPAAEFLAPTGGVFTNSTTILFTGNNPTQSRTTQLIKDGTTLSHTASDFINISTNAALTKDSIKKIADDFALVCTLGSADGTVIGSDVSTIFSGYDLVLGGGQP